LANDGLVVESSGIRFDSDVYLIRFMRQLLRWHGVSVTMDELTGVRMRVSGAGGLYPCVPWVVRVVARLRKFDLLIAVDSSQSSGLGRNHDWSRPEWVWV